MDEIEMLKELRTIKKLLILHLKKCGTPTMELRAVLGLNGKEFGKLMPAKIGSYRNKKDG